MAELVIHSDPPLRPRGRGHALRRVLRHPEGAVGAVMLLVVVGLALIGPVVAPHDLAQPINVPGMPPMMGAPLGTDELGRDVLSRLLFGGLPVLALSVVSIAITYGVGIQLGMLAGISSETRLDGLVMRTVDVLIAFPPLLLLLLLISGGGGGFWVMALGIALVLFPGVTRIVRSAASEIAASGYVEAAIVRGESRTAVMYREILPNIIQTVLADLGVRFAGAIVLAASINFLGLGAQPPEANWGLMIAENREILPTNLWAVAAPAALLALLTISINLLADAYIRSLGHSERTE